MKVDSNAVFSKSFLFSSPEASASYPDLRLM